MNRLFGFFSFKKNSIDDTLLARCQYRSDLWEPDHRASFSDHSIALNSTQRFITPECHRALMPFRHPDSGCVIVADAYLTSRQVLCELLNASIQLADAELILLAYLKWGEAATKYLNGYFCFAIWNPGIHELFLATDHFSNRPLLYAYEPGNFFAFSNEMSSFRQVCSKLTVNENLFAHFALDSLPAAETCYQEINKLLPAHQLRVTATGVQQSCYWRLQDQKQILPYRTREEYYQAFQEIFKEATSHTLRAMHPIAAHISGGLDSSSVAAQAAILLNERQEKLFALTAVPNGLDGPSDRPNWYYHEMPRVQALLDQHSNIQHTIYKASPHTNMFDQLETYYPFVDQPFRNISNFDWLVASFEHVRIQGGRVLLTGARGNGTISWAALSWKSKLRNYFQSARIWLQPASAFNHLFENCEAGYLRSSKAKQILRDRAIALDPHMTLLSGHRGARLHTSLYPVLLWDGVTWLDPTQDLNLVKFCYNVPDWVCREGRGALRNRLLVRRGLAHILPEAISQNPYRGEQAADWFLHYNQHGKKWHDQLRQVSCQAQEILDRYYDRQKYLAMQNTFSLPLKQYDQKARITLDFLLMRYMSAAFFLNYLEA